MLTFIAVIHVVVALIIVGLVLIQDSKGNGAFGASSSQSLLGATGAQSLVATMTVYVGIVFAITSISLSYFSASRNNSVIDDLNLPGASAPQNPPPAPTSAQAPTAESTQNANKTSDASTPEQNPATAPEKK